MLKCGRGSGDQQGAHLSAPSFYITVWNYPSPSIWDTQFCKRSTDTAATDLITCKRRCAEAECYGLHCLFKSMLGGLCSFAKEGWQGSKATEAKAAKKVLKTELSLQPEGIPANTTLCTRDPRSTQLHAAVKIEVWVNIFVRTSFRSQLLNKPFFDTATNGGSVLVCQGHC